MIYKAYKDKTLSRLGMGNMRLPVHADKEGRPIDYAKAQEIIDYAMANGINYYDTAYVYHDGESEKFLGEAMKKYPRESYHLATKFFIHANPDYKAVFEEQLSRLQTDYIDFYLIHALGNDTCDTYLNSGCIEYFLEKKAEGKIRHLGFSSHADPEYLKKFAEHHAWDFCQLQMNYFDWNFGTTKAEYDIVTELGIPVVVMEPVRGGRLASLTPEAEALLKNAHPDWSIASWAFRWLQKLDNVQVVLSGMSTLDQIVDNVSTFSADNALSDEDEAILFKAVELFRSKLVVPCTACRYCTDNCPAQINIPEIMKIYNDFKVDGPWALRGLENVDSAGKPTDCVGCGLCATHCPQNIDIPGIMAELTEIMNRPRP